MKFIGWRRFRNSIAVWSEGSSYVYVEMYGEISAEDVYVEMYGEISAEDDVVKFCV